MSQDSERTAGRKTPVSGQEIIDVNPLQVEGFVNRHISHAAD